MESANILIVEDEPLEAEHLKLHLQQAGHRIMDTVSTGEAAIARAEQGNIDLMLIDIVLSGEIDGIEAVQRIRDKHDIPVIYLTAHVSDELLLRAEQTFPFSYILKPYQQRELEFMINMCLARVKVVRELAAQKQVAEAELHQAHAIIQHTNEGIMLTNKDKIIVSVNPAFTRITGYQASECIGKKTSLLSSGKHEAEFYADMWSSINQQDHWQGEIWNRRKNGEVYPGWLTISSIYDTDGSLSHYVGIFLDITAVKQTEMEKDRLQRELNQRHKMEALGQLTGGIAHDFNNMLGIIMGYIEMSLDRYRQDVPEKMTTYLESAMQASERARDLIAQMLTFTGNDNWDEQALQFLPLVKENVKMLRTILPSSIKVELNAADELPKIMISPAKLQQMLMNLCINAKDAMEGVGSLKINLAWRRDVNQECSCCHKWIKGDWIELSVSDTGSGMTPETVEHLFEPFYTTKEIGEGRGMGLSMLHGIVSSYGAHAIVETKLAKGTTISLLFPPAEKSVSEKPETQALSAKHPQRSGMNILILDDEPMMADYISTLLQAHGYNTTIKNNSLEVLHLFQAEPDKFALLVTDQTMPELTGVELIKQVRDIRPDLPVILCSGYSEAINRTDAENLGCYYLDKPIDSERLVKSAGELLGLTIA